MNTPRVCAVTGAGGYLGSRMKRSFERQGWRVLELTRQPRAGGGAAFHLGAEVAPETLAGVSVLVHCAYDFRAVKWPEIHATNVVGTEKLLRAATAAGVGKIICISTISAYDGCRSLYGKAKLEIERLALAAGALVLRPGLIHGDEPRAMFGQLVRQVSGASVLPLVGGDQVQYLVHEEDLCAFALRFAEGSMTSPLRLLTAAHERAWTFREILEALARTRGRRVRLIPVPWRLIWLPMKLAEVCGLRLGFRSDSLVSLMHQNPRPDFSPNAAAGLICRPFQPEQLRL